MQFTLDGSLRRSNFHGKRDASLDTALHGASTLLLNEPEIAYLQALNELQSAVAHWSAIYTKAGIEFVVDDVAQITEPSPRGDYGVVAGAGGCNLPSTASQQELDILSTRTVSERVIYVYYIHHFCDSIGNPLTAAGRTYTTDTFTNTQPDSTGSGIFVARFGVPIGQSVLGVRNVGEQIGHEVGHFLLQYSQISDGSVCSNEHTTDDAAFAGRVMFPTVGFRSAFTDAERDNFWTGTNPYNPWIEHF